MRQLLRRRPAAKAAGFVTEACLPHLTAAAADSGFRIDAAEVIFWGRCPECLAANPESAGD